YFVSGEVSDWHTLAHRSIADLEATGMRLRLNTTAERIDVEAHAVHIRDPEGAPGAVEYDALVIGTGAVPVRPPIEGLEHLGPQEGVHVVHSMGVPFAVMYALTPVGARRA